MPRRSHSALTNGTVALLCLLAGLLVADALGETPSVQPRMERLYALDDPRFVQELGLLTGPPFLPGTQVRALFNGDQIFPPMLAAIRGARLSITFETHHLGAGDVGRAFVNALAERARQGVKVHVLLDGVGSAAMDRGQLVRLAQAGAQVRLFQASRWWQQGGSSRRTHRNLLIVDGRVAFAGSAGVAPRWTGHAQDREHWRDTHFEVQGPVVGQMQSVFMDHWTRVTGSVLHGPNYFPLLAPTGPALAQMLGSSHGGGSNSVQLTMLMAMTAASRSIDLSAPHFSPDTQTQRTLLDALHRGVRVRVVVAGQYTDPETGLSASRAGWGPLLRAGATIAEYGPTVYHCKVLIVDGLFTAVGSSTLDHRAFQRNDEATLNTVDRAMASALTEAFESDLRLATPVTHAQWTDRPWRERLREGLVLMVGMPL